MAGSTLLAISVEISTPVFAAMQEWAFEEDFVARILAEDIPQRVKYGQGRVWVYADSQRNLVGFGTIDICKDYGDLTGDTYHAYIPLLAVHPDHRGKGYGRVVVDHLTGEAACTISEQPSRLHPAVFLDVYEQSAAAYALYQKCGFVDLAPDCLVDPINGERYRVMAKRVL